MQQNIEVNPSVQHQYVSKSIEEESGFFSRIFFVWTNKIVQFGNKNTFTQEALFEVPKIQKFNYCTQQFSQVIEEHYKKTGKYSVQHALWAVNKKPILKMIFLLQIANVLQFMQPLLLQQILKFLMYPELYNEYDGYIYAACMTILQPILVILRQNAWHQNILNYQRTQACLSYIVFQKVFKLSTSSRAQLDVGKIQNIQQIDCQQIQSFVMFGFTLLTSPLTLLISIILIIIQVGWIGTIGIGVIVLGTLINSLFIKKMHNFRKEKLSFTDQKSRALSEYFQGIRLIKFYGWEQMVIDKIMGIRKKETSLLLKETVNSGYMQFVFNLVPILIQISVFGIYVYQGNILTPVVAFTTLTLFNMVQGPLSSISFAVFSLINFFVSAKRINFYLSYQDKQGFSEITQDQESQFNKGDILIRDGDFCWENNETLEKHAEFQKLMMKDKKKPKKNSVKNSKKSKIDTELTKPLLKEDQQNSDSQQQQRLTLKNINVNIKQGEFIGVIGQTGAGKTSLVYAMMGEIYRQKGFNYSKGKIAYISQSTWLQNATLRDNILFGKEMNEEKYNNILKICELMDDLEILPGKDLAEIGEKGLNLSGGQKQRISIARALYADQDIYIIDDCLSALDSYVGQKIYDNVIRGYLKHKTVVFVTHGLRYIKEVDRLFVLKDGMIVEQNTHEILQQNPESEYNKLLMIIKESDKKSNENSDDDQQELNLEKKKSSKQKEKQIDQKSKENQNLGKLTLKEEKKVGSVSGKVYMQYFRSGGFCFAFCCVFLIMFAKIISQSNSLWLAAWSIDKFHKDSTFYIIGFSILGISTGVSNLISNIVFFNFARRVSNNVQKKLLFSLFRSPMSWFDQIPSGRILNRCTKDQDDIDSTLPMNMSSVLSMLLGIITLFLLSSSIIPLFLVIFLCFFPLFIMQGKMYINPARDTKRIESVTRSPIIQQLVESSQGYIEIRNYDQIEQQSIKYEKNQNMFIKAIYNNRSLNRWLQLRIQYFSTLCIGSAAFMAVSSRWLNYTSDAALIGVALTAVQQAIDQTNWIIVAYSGLEVSMNSLERIDEWIDELEYEKEWNNEKVDTTWPQTGEYKAKNVTFKYREDLPNVIKGISFDIANKEKIGVVGRTGSGKSTLTLGLLRIIEISGDEGSISLSGVNQGEVGLHQLRQRVTIIPQEPILFTGSLRFNIDPFSEYSDEVLIQALKKTTIWDQIQPNAETDQEKIINQQDERYQKSSLNLEDKAKLYFQIYSGGTNFSLGQKQLICLARGLVRKSKVLLMDEATASIDEYTDHLIQKMIKTEFKDTTVITIAHRLNTIIQYDRVMVMEEGNLVEMDTPINLMNQNDSYFRKLIKSQGPQFEKKMRYLAENKLVNLNSINDEQLIINKQSEIEQE